MNVNLKKAAALAAALSAATVKFDHAYAVDVYADAPTEETVARGRVMLQQQIVTALALGQAAFAIRSLIGKANEGRINDLLTRRALIDKQLSLVNGIPSRRQGTNLAALDRQIGALRDGDKAVGVYGARGLTLDLETETIVSPVLRDLRRAKRDLDDELQAVNFNTTIELPADVVAVLTDLDLV